MRIELDQRDALDARVLQHLAHRHAVAAAEHEDAARRAVRGERRMDERLVVAVLVARMELQVAVEEEADAGAAGRHDDALVRARRAVDHAVGVEAVLGPGRDDVGSGERGDEGRDRQERGGGVGGESAQLGAE